MRRLNSHSVQPWVAFNSIWLPSKPALVGSTLSHTKPPCASHNCCSNNKTRAVQQDFFLLSIHSLLPEIIIIVYSIAGDYLSLSFPAMGLVNIITHMEVKKKLNPPVARAGARHTNRCKLSRGQKNIYDVCCTSPQTMLLCTPHAHQLILIP